MTPTKRPFPSESPEIRLCKRHKNSHESGIATSSAQSEPAQEAIPPKLAGIKRTSSEGFQENEENQENAKRRKPNMLYIESNDEAPSKEATPKSSDNNGCMECFKSCAEEIGLSSTRESLATLDEATQINEQRVEALQEEEEEEEDEEGGENGEDAADDGMSNETDIASTPELSEDDSSDETSSVATDGSEVWPSDSSDNSDYSGDEDDSEGDDESISSSESEVWSSDAEEEMLVLKEDPDAEEEMLVLKEDPDAEEEMLVLKEDTDAEEEMLILKEDPDTEEEMLILKEDPDSEDEVLSCPTCNGTGVVQKVRARYASLPLRPDQYPDHSYGDPSIATHSGLSRVHHEAKMAADANYRRRFHGGEQVEVPSLPTAGEVLLLTMASLLVLFILLLLSRDASPDAPKTDFLTLPPA